MEKIRREAKGARQKRETAKAQSVFSATCYSKIMLVNVTAEPVSGVKA